MNHERHEIIYKDKCYAIQGAAFEHAAQVSVFRVFRG